MTLKEVQEKIRVVMDQMSEFTLANWQEPVTAQLVARYGTLYHEYVSLYEELIDFGQDPPSFKIVSTLTDEEYDQMIEWVQGIITLCERNVSLSTN